MSAQTATNTRLALQNDLGNLGARLVRFGQALQDPNSTVGQLNNLASSCGIQLRLRAVAESGGTDEQPR